MPSFNRPIQFLNFFFFSFVSESEEETFVTAPEYPNNADGASTNQPSLPLRNKTVVVGEDLNSDQVTGEKKEENESDDTIKKKEPPTIPEKTGAETTLITYFLVFPITESVTV